MDFSKLLVETYLVEGIVDQVKLQNPDIAPEIIDRYNDEALPKNDKTHLPWVIKQHKLGNVTPETATHLQPYIASYMKNKDLIGANINKFDVDGLRDAVKRHFEKDKSELIAKDKNVKTLHEDNDLLVQQHKGWEAAAAMGSLPENNPYHATLNGHARWCISLRGGNNKHYVNNYTKGGKHPIVSITNKHTGRKYALVMNPNSSNPEFRDEHDSRPNMEDFLSDNPSIIDTKVGGFLHKHFPAARDYIDRFGGKKVDKLTTGDITKLYHENSDDTKFQSQLLKHKNVSPELLHEDYKENSSNSTDGYNPHLVSLSHKNFPKHILDQEVDKAVKTGINIHDLSKHAHLNSDHIDKILDTKNPYAVSSLARNENITFNTSHMKKALKINGSIYDDLIKKATAPEDIRTIYNKAKKDGYVHITNTGPNTHNRRYDGDGIRNPLIDSIASNKNTPSDVLGSLLYRKHGDMSPSESQSIRNHKNFNSDSVDAMLEESKAHSHTHLNYNRAMSEVKLDQKTQDKLADHYINENNSDQLKVLLNNKSLTSKTANHIYEHTTKHNKDYSLFERDGIDKLSDANIKHMLGNADEYQKRNISGVGMSATDFTKRPNLFDVYNEHSGWNGTRNNTINSDMIDKLHQGKKWMSSDYIEHPNTSDKILSGLYDEKKSNKSKILDCGGISKGLQDHILKTSLDHVNGVINMNYKPIIKKLVNHDSADDSTYSKVLKIFNKPNSIITHDEDFKKDILHEMAKHVDKMSNRTFDTFTNSKLHEKTVDDLLKTGNLTGDQLHTLVKNNHRYFVKKYPDETVQNEDLLKTVMNHPSLKDETISHMLSNNQGHQYIADNNRNYILRKFHERQGQLSLPIKWKNK